MKTIFRTAFGSMLYGTNTPQSDRDFKSIFIPNERDIILQKVKQVQNTQRPKGIGEKNFAGELDQENFSLQKYLHLLSEGQTVALDVLFSPESAWMETPSPEWFEIVENKERLITKKASSFIGYCRQQASKYGVKGARLAAAKAALELVKNLILMDNGKKQKLFVFEEALVAATKDHSEYMEFILIDQPNSEPINHWCVCGRKLPFNTSLKNAFEVLDKLVNDYGSRTIQAEKDGGVDWKALSHAVRIAHQAVELLETGKITFPLLNVEHIKAIKFGQLPYKEVAEEIEDMLYKVEGAMEASNLRAEPDYEWINDFIYRVYKKEILDGGKS